MVDGKRISCILREVFTSGELLDYINDEFTKNKYKNSFMIYDILESILQQYDEIFVKNLKNVLAKLIKIKFDLSDNHKISNPLYWIIRGYSRDESEEMVKTHQSFSVKKRTRSSYDNLKFTSKTSKQYWVNLGYTDDEIRDILKKIQGRGKPFYKSKGCSDIEIDNRIKARTLAWQTTLNKSIELDPSINSRKGKTFEQLCQLHGKERAVSIIKSKTSGKCNRYSVSSQTCIVEILRFLNVSEDDCNFGTTEYFLNDGCNFYMYDFKYKNIMIEFNGDFWHMNPKFYDLMDINPVTKKLAMDVWDYDKRKELVANDRGFLVYVIWESAWRDDKMSVLNDLKKYVQNNLKN